MTTIRALGEKYGGVIADFVSECDQKGINCETEVSKNEMVNELISSLKNGEMLSSEQVIFSRSEKLITETEKMHKKLLVKAFDKLELKTLKDVYGSWNSLFDSKFKRTLLEKFCYCGQLEGVQWVIEISSNVNYRKAFGFACSCGQLEIAQYIFSLCQDIEIEPRSCDEEVTVENWPLNIFSWTCYHGKIEVAKWLLEVKPSINVRYNDDEPFRYACENNHLELAKWLLEIRPDIDVRALRDEVYNCAVEEGYTELEEWLISICPELENLY